MPVIPLTKKQKNKLWTFALIISIIASFLIIFQFFGLKPYSLVPGAGNVIISTSIQSDTIDYKTISLNYKSDCGDGKTSYDYGTHNFGFNIGDSGTYIKFLPEYQPNEIPFLIENTYFDATSVSIIDGASAVGKCKVIKEGAFNDQLYSSCGNTPGCSCTTNTDGSGQCTNGGKSTFRIRVTDCQVNGNYTCNNPSGCEVPNFCGINIIFNAYKEGHLPQPITNITVFRFENNKCTEMNILSNSRTNNDYDTLEDCQKNIKVNLLIIFLVVFIIVGLIILLTWIYLKTRSKNGRRK